jgi:signal transduction histidine kinase
MAEKRRRRRFTAEFKAAVVRRLLDSGHGLSEVAAELGLSTQGGTGLGLAIVAKVMAAHGGSWSAVDALYP